MHASNCILWGFNWFKRHLHTVHRILDQMCWCMPRYIQSKFFLIMLLRNLLSQWMCYTWWQHELSFATYALKYNPHVCAVHVSVNFLPYGIWQLEHNFTMVTYSNAVDLLKLFNGYFSRWKVFFLNIEVNFYFKFIKLHKVSPHLVIRKIVAFRREKVKLCYN